MSGDEVRIAAAVEALLCQCHERICPIHNEAADDTIEFEVSDLLARLVGFVATAQAEAWDEGRAVERMHARQVADYHHWSSISAGPPADPPNPYGSEVNDA